MFFKFSWFAILLIFLGGMLLLRAISRSNSRTIAVTMLALGGLALLAFTLVPLGLDDRQTAVVTDYTSHSAELPTPLATQTRSQIDSTSAGGKESKIDLSQVEAEISGNFPKELDAVTTRGVTVPDSPEWVSQQGFKREGGVTFATVSVGPFATREECERALPGELQRVTRLYIETLYNDEIGRQLELPLNYIQNRIRQPDELEQPTMSTVGPMLYLHTRLKFDDQVRADLDQLYQRAKITSRLSLTGGIAALVLVLVGTLFGYLKLDTATKGYYSGRLKLAASAVILAIGAATFALSRTL